MTRIRQRTHHKLDGQQQQKGGGGFHYSESVQHQQQQFYSREYVAAHQAGHDDTTTADYLTDELHPAAAEHFLLSPPPHIVQFLLQQLVFSRLFLLLFQCAINAVMRDHGTDAFKGIHPAGSEDQQNWLLNTLISGLCRWDAVHFLHIAEFGYLWESSLAFFPLFPTILRTLGQTIQQLTGEALGLPSAMAIGGIALNNTLFVLNGLLLFRLALLLNGGSLKEAILTVYIHCWCPASIFYSSLYSESLYLALTLFGLIQLHSSPPNRSNLVVVSALFSLAFLTRSNGLVNIGFVGFHLFLDAILVRCSSTASGHEGSHGHLLHHHQQQQQLEFRDCSVDTAKRLANNFLFFLFCFGLMSLPLRVFEFAMRDKFCTLSVARFVDKRVEDFLLARGNNSTGLVLPGDVDQLHWCANSSSSWAGALVASNLLLPSYYPHVQHKYWDVSLFGYWQWRKLPLFLMAAPTLWLAFYGVYKHTFCLLSNDFRPIPEILADRTSQMALACHTTFLAISGLIFYNVEVSTRLLFSSSPFLYLVLARLIGSQTPAEHGRAEQQLMDSRFIPFLRVYMRLGLMPCLIFCYLFAFFIFGTMMHVNWLPFV